MDNFCLKNFIKWSDSRARAFIDYDPEAFTQHVNDWLTVQIESPLVEGYAPFCKHLFIPNWVASVHNCTMEITEKNKHLLESDYVSRTPKELAVLQRWFPKEIVGEHRQMAKFLDVILYSREQLLKEAEARGEECKDTEEWGIVSIKPQNIDTELPMEPITMLRNALGKKEGGSGVPLDADAYQKSVEFWKVNARIV